MTEISQLSVRTALPIMGIQQIKSVSLVQILGTSGGNVQIGTYNAAVIAARHKIPFIVVAPVSTVDLDISDGSK